MDVGMDIGVGIVTDIGNDIDVKMAIYVLYAALIRRQDYVAVSMIVERVS